MAIDLMNDTGTPLEQQLMTWREMVRPPYSKLDVDAFTRVRVILMNGIEAEAQRFSHSFARMRREHRAALALVRRIDQHQQTMINWLNPPDQSPLETTIAFEQAAIEVTASVAKNEPDPYLAQVYRFGLLEDFDHMYRYAGLMDRVGGRDAATAFLGLLQNYSDVLPGRPTSLEHRHPVDDLRRPYEREQVTLQSKLHARTILAGGHMMHDYHMTVGPMFADPVARQLYAEIASVEEQHVTQYESIIDPDETWLEKWLLHEACEVYNYWSCVETEADPHVRPVWERFLDYELGQLRFVAELFENVERRDAAEILDEPLLSPIEYQSHRAYIRDVLSREVGLSATGYDFVDRENELHRTRGYRDHLNADGSPSDMSHDPG